METPKHRSFAKEREVKRCDQKQLYGACSFQAKFLTTARLLYFLPIPKNQCLFYAINIHKCKKIDNRILINSVKITKIRAKNTTDSVFF